MKIVYIVGNLGNSGGIERVLSTKANYFADLIGYEVHIIVGGKRPNSLFYHFSDKINFHFLAIDFPSQKPWHYMIGTKEKELYYKKVQQLLVRIKPDVTISLFGQDAEFLYKIKDGSRKILEFHFTKNYLKHLGESLVNDKYRFFRKYWLLFLQKREEHIAEKYDHIVLLTQKDKELWGGGDKFEVIPNPLSFTTDKQAALENKLIVSMGRLVYPKGFQYLIRAFSLLKDKYPDWKITIYGEGHDKELLQKEINTLSLQENIFLKDPVQNVESVLLESSLFVLPSLYDGFGLVLTEAMACGVPCIAFDCECGPSEILTDNQDGFLVEVKNVEELAKQMAVLMSDIQLRKAMRIQAKENVQRFDLIRIMEKWERYLNN
ncbi:glycosyl transferase [Bacteroidia bacterium]|nr:glycosyl transferase [Bacteroidia bacterium]